MMKLSTHSLEMYSMLGARISSRPLVILIDHLVFQPCLLVDGAQQPHRCNGPSPAVHEEFTISVFLISTRPGNCALVDGWNVAPQPRRSTCVVYGMPLRHRCVNQICTPGERRESHWYFFPSHSSTLCSDALHKKQKTPESPSP